MGGREADKIVPQVREGIKVRFQMTRRRVKVLLAFLTVLLGIPVTASASYAAASTGWLRLGNLSATTSAVDVYLYSSGDSSPQFVLPNVTYGMVSAYRSVSAGDYSVKMRSAGSAASSQPVLAANVTVQSGKSYTATALSAKGKAAQLRILNDELTTPTGKSLVRVIQASDKQNGVKFHCSCAAGAAGDIVSKASSGSVSAYASIPPGTWTMSATGSSGQASLPVTLTGSTVHTEVVIDGSNGLEIVNLVDAAGAGQPPTGGASTGFGGTAPHGPGSPLPWLAVIGAGVLLVLTGGIRLRRNRLRRLTNQV
jgi:Domain of unknown function (DUF4397)